MDTETATPVDRIMIQHAAIAELSDRLAEIANNMTGDIDLDNAGWREVGIHAQIASMATSMLAQMNESGI